MLCLLVSTMHPFISISSTMKCACVESRRLSTGCQSSRRCIQAHLHVVNAAIHWILRHDRAAKASSFYFFYGALKAHLRHGLEARAFLTVAGIFLWREAAPFPG